MSLKVTKFDIDKRDLEEIFLPVDLKRTGIIPTVEFDNRLKSSNIVMPQEGKDALRAEYRTTSKEIAEASDYKKFIQDLILVYPLYAEVIGKQESFERKPEVVVLSVLKHIFDNFKSLRDYAEQIDRGVSSSDKKKGYLNKGDIKTAMLALKPAIVVTDPDLEEIYSIVDLKKELKVYYYKFEENLKSRMLPLIADFSGRIFNGLQQGQEPLGVKVAGAKIINKQWVSIPDMVGIMKQYSNSILETHIWQLIGYLDIPLKDLDRFKYADFTSSYFLLLDRMQIRPVQVLQQFFSSVPHGGKVDGTISGASSPTAAGRGIGPNTRSYILTLKQKLRILNEDDARDVFKRMDQDSSGTVTQEEMEKMLSHRIPEMKKEYITKVFEIFNKNGNGKVTIEDFVKVTVVEVPDLEDRRGLLVEKDSMGRGSSD